MPIFEYKAKKTPTEIETGKIEADSYSGAVSKLNERGLYPIQVNISGKSILLNRNSLTISDRSLILVTREISDLLNSGVNLINALQILTEQSLSKKLQFITMEIMQSVKEGSSFSGALSFFPKIFSPLYINVVKSGEMSGKLEQVMLRLAKFYENKQILKGKIIQALAYPAFLICMGIAAVSVLVVYVIPKLTPMFEDIGTKLPLPTQIIMNISQFFYSYWHLVIIFIIFIVLLFLRMINSYYWKTTIQNKLLSIPLIGDFKSSHHLSEIFQSLESLISNGISTIEAIEVTEQSCSFYPYKEALKQIRNDISNGDLLSRSLEKAKVFPKRVFIVIRVGEEGGRLDVAMQKLAFSYTEAFEKTASILTNVAGPVFIIIIAIMVGFIIIAMLLPLLNLNVAI